MVGHAALVRLTVLGKEQRRRRRGQPRRGRSSGSPQKLGQELEGFDNGAEEDEAEDIGKGIPGFVGGGGSGGGRGRGGRIIVRNDTIDANDDVFDLGHEGVEAAGYDAATAEGLDVADLVKNKEEEGIG